MNKEQQIEEIMLTIPQKIVAYNGDPKGQHLYGEQRLQIAEVLYNAGYRKVPKGSFICSADETNLDVEVCNNCGMKQANELFERDKEIERLKAENKQLQEQLNSANAGNVNCSGCEMVETNAVKEFAEHLKKYAIKTNSPAWGLIEFVEVSDIDRLLDYYRSMRDER